MPATIVAETCPAPKCNLSRRDVEGLQGVPADVLIETGTRLVQAKRRRHGWASTQDQPFSLTLELESRKAYHHHGVGSVVDEKDIADHRGAQSDANPRLVALYDVGIAPRPVSRLLKRCNGRLGAMDEAIRHLERGLKATQDSFRREKDFNKRGVIYFVRTSCGQGILDARLRLRRSLPKECLGYSARTAVPP
jgi:hypothetical protein